MDENTIEAIYDFVWSGFCEKTVILEIICEQYIDPDETSESDVEKAIREEFARKKEAETHWPEITDCDKLDQAFEKLNDTGIIALHYAGTTQSDGLDDVTEMYYELGGKDSNVTGYCFYHGQDVDGAIESGELYIAFGDIHGTDEKGVETGLHIKKTLTEAGFDVVWDGAIDQRICIRNMAWQRRGPGSE
jgi:hypothetical protein